MHLNRESGWRLLGMTLAVLGVTLTAACEGENLFSVPGTPGAAGATGGAAMFISPSVNWTLSQTGVFSSICMPCISAFMKAGRFLS